MATWDDYRAAPGCRMIPPTEITSAAAWPKMREEHREYFTERAGINEYEGGLPRARAEAVALIETRRHFRRLNGRDAA